MARIRGWPCAAPRSKSTTANVDTFQQRSTASPLWCGRRGSTVTATSVCWRPMRPCAPIANVRQSRYIMLARVDGKDTQTVINALVKHAQELPHELYQSLT